MQAAARASEGSLRRKRAQSERFGELRDHQVTEVQRQWRGKKNECMGRESERDCEADKIKMTPALEG